MQKHKKHKHCSEKCAYTVLNKKAGLARIRFCVGCERNIYISSGKFCRSCVKNSGKRAILKNCVSCTKEFEASNEARERNIYCSPECKTSGTCSMCKTKECALQRGLCRWCLVGASRKQVVSIGEQLLRRRVGEVYEHSKEIRYNYRPKWLIPDGRRYPLELDVALVDLKLGFEYDGRVHHDPTHPGYVGTHMRDLLKNDICYNNGWTLIRVCGIQAVKHLSSFLSVLNAMDMAADMDTFVSNKLLKQVTVAAHNRNFGWSKHAEG